jgi:hypothetical protein
LRSRSMSRWNRGVSWKELSGEGMIWGLKALLVGTSIALACIGAGYLLSRAMPGDEWPYFAIAVLALVAVYLVASSFPRRLAPSHTQGPRDPIQNTGFQQMAYHIAENPGDGSRSRHRFSPDFLIAAVPLFCAIIVMVFLAG